MPYFTLQLKARAENPVPRLIETGTQGLKGSNRARERQKERMLVATAAGLGSFHPVFIPNLG
jgi:hypothetical protein